MGKTRDTANLISDGNLSVDITNDRVGIGSTVPQYKLDVSGDINFTGTFRQNGTQFVASRWTTGTGNDIYRLSGNIGIGTTNPTSPLSVQGNTLVSGITTINTELDVGIGATILTALPSGRIGVGNTNPIGQLQISSGPVIIGAATSTGTASQTLQVTGGAYVSGNTGIGTTNPTLPLHVRGTTAARFDKGDSTQIAQVRLRTNQDSYATEWALGQPANSLNFSIAYNNTSSWNEYLRIDSSGNILINSTSSTGTASQPLQVTGGAYVSGSIGVGTTNPNGVSAQTSQLTMSGSNSGGGAGYHQFLVVNSTTATNPNKFFRMNSTGGIEIINSAYTTNLFTLDNSGNLSVAGNVTAYSSDERLKENVKNLENPLEKVLQLNGCTFDWNEKSKELGFTPKYETNDIGLLAQEVEKVLPQAVAPAPFDIETNEFGENVSKSGENYLTIQYERLVPLLVEAIKELKEEVNEMKKRLEDV